MIKAVLFDLDDTLVPEAATWEAAFNAACASAARQRRLDLEGLRHSVFKSAQDLWNGSPVFEYCRDVGIGSPSSLLSEFPGDGPELAYLRDWAPEYRRQAWTAGLAAVGVSDAELVNQCAESFKAVFSTLHKPFADVKPALDILDDKRLAVVTNGTSDLQRTKLKVSGLDPRFDAIVISAELGFGKPDPRIFEMTLKQIGVEPQGCLMVGDSLFRDVEGASIVGIAAVLLDRSDPGPKNPQYEGARIRTLEELPPLLEVFP